MLVHLKRTGLSAIGTVRQNQVKAAINISKKSARGTCSSLSDENSKLNYITVMDAKHVYILSTTYGIEPKIQMKRWVDKSHQIIEYPNVFSYYNRKMGEVDLHDQHCNAVMPVIRGKKWTWCLFLRLIQASLTNATVLYNLAHPEDRKGTKDVVKEVCQYYLEDSVRKRTIQFRNGRKS